VGRAVRAGLSGLVLASLLLAGYLADPGMAAAHALLQSSEPAAGSTVGAPPKVIVLRFGEAPDPQLSTIHVLDASGADHVAGDVTAAAGAPLALSTAVDALPDGVYTVSWRTVSSVDGHSAAGSFAFGVGVAPPSPGASAPPVGGAGSGASPASTLARWLLYAGLILLVGTGFVAAAVVPRPPRRLAGLAVVAWGTAGLGTLAVVALQWADAGVAIEVVIGTSVGLAGIARLVVVVMTGALALTSLRLRGRRLRGALLGVAILGSLGMVVDVLNGHAAAAPNPIVEMAAQWIHVAAVGLWLGGLAALLVALPATTNNLWGAAVRRYSTWAGVALAAVAISGLLRALQEIGTLDALFGTDAGRLVVAKTALLVGLVALGALNRFVSVPRAAISLARLRRVGSTEVVVGAVVIVLSAILVNLAPPSSSGSPAGPLTQPVIAVGSDAGTSVRVRLVVAPGNAGFNDFDLAVVDYDTGAAAAVPTASLRFELRSRSGLGASTLDLTRTGPGAFHGSGGNLSPDGIWSVTATIGTASGAVEVPLVLATRAGPSTTEQNVSPGAPTITTIHLPDGSSVQAYIDPGVAGSNELHATFFDASGNGLPLTRATMAVFPVDTGGQLLQPRLLEPGHFVAEIDAVAGQLGVDVVGRADDNTQVHVHATIEVQP
jgi:copper transport protein